jgi:hypothetical protein
MSFSHKFNPYHTRGLKDESLRAKYSHQNIDKLDRIEHYRSNEQDHGITSALEWRREQQKMIGLMNRRIESSQAARTIRSLTQQ